MSNQTESLNGNLYKRMPITTRAQMNELVSEIIRSHSASADGGWFKQCLVHGKNFYEYCNGCSKSKAAIAAIMKDASTGNGEDGNQQPSATPAESTTAPSFARSSEISVVDEDGLNEALLTLRPRVWMDYQEQAMIGEIPLAQIPILTEMWSVKFRPYLEKAIGAYLSTSKPVSIEVCARALAIATRKSIDKDFDIGDSLEVDWSCYINEVKAVLEAAGVPHVD